MLGGSLQFVAFTDLLDPNGTFATFAPGLAALIDELIIFIDRRDSDFDNFVPNADSVPEPTSLALLGLGIAGLSLQRKKRATA